MARRSEFLESNADAIGSLLIFFLYQRDLLLGFPIQQSSLFGNNRNTSDNCWFGSNCTSVSDSSCISESAEGSVYYLSADQMLEANEKEVESVIANEIKLVDQILWWFRATIFTFRADFV